MRASKPPIKVAYVPLAAASDDQLTYRKAGVDIDAGDELVKRIQKLNPSIGGFSGLVPFGDSFLVAGTDGVGTKLKLAFDMNKVCTVLPQGAKMSPCNLFKFAPMHRSMTQLALISLP